MLEVTPTAIPAVKLIRPRAFGDPRGLFFESYNRERFAQHGITFDFVQDNQSSSALPGTLRGLHFQIPPKAQHKLVRVLRGRIFDVAVDIRRGSPTYGHWISQELSDENRYQLLIPVGFAHGFCTLEPDTVVTYKVTDYYAPEHDLGITWNDPQLAIDWPIASDAVVLSEKDKRQPTLAELDGHFTYQE